MKKTKIRLTLCCTLLLAILAFIWGNSAMPGEESGALSGWVGQLLCKLLPFLSLEDGIGMYILRKLAHFSEFAALGMVLSWLFGMVTPGRIRQWLLPLCCGVAAACVDETIQIFSPGRYSSIVDVSIDSAGVLTGIVALLLLYAISKGISKRSKDSVKST